MHDDGLAASSIARHRVAMRQLFKFLVDEALIPDNPSLLISAPRIPRKLPATLTEAQVSAILKAPDRSQALGLRDAAMLELLYATGLRVSEPGQAPPPPMARWLARCHGKGREGPTGSIWRQRQEDR